MGGRTRSPGRVPLPPPKTVAPSGDGRPGASREPLGCAALPRAAHSRRGGQGRAAAALSARGACWRVTPVPRGSEVPGAPSPPSPVSPAPGPWLVLGRCIPSETKKRSLWSGSSGSSASACGVGTGCWRRPVCPSWAGGVGMAPRRWKRFFGLW